MPGLYFISIPNGWPCSKYPNYEEDFSQIMCASQKVWTLSPDADLVFDLFFSLSPQKKQNSEFPLKSEYIWTSKSIKYLPELNELSWI